MKFKPVELRCVMCHQLSGRFARSQKQFDWMKDNMMESVCKYCKED